MDLLTILSATPNPLFGQQRAYSSGQYPAPWQATAGTYSDIGVVTGRAPVIYGFPLNTILKNKKTTILNQTINHLIELTNAGVLIEFDWHMGHPSGNGYKSDPNIPDRNIASILPGGAYHQHFKGELDYLATFFNQLKENSVFALFRPFHEMNGAWFWWGYGQGNTNTPEEYKTLFNFVADYLGSQGVDNLAYVFAPNARGVNTESHYNLFYPGDVVDVIGLDMYVKNPLQPLNNLLFLNQFAEEKGKLLALTEFGYSIEGLSGGTEQAVFFSNLAQFMSYFDFAYARTWGGNYIPSSGATREDFLNNFIPNISLLVEFDSLTWSVESLNAAQNEGDSAGQLFTFTITRQGDISGLSLVAWFVSGSGLNSADGEDFVGGVLPSGSAYFVAGEASKVITIAVQGDTVIEPDELFTVSLVNPQTDSLLSGAAAQGVIQNDDHSQLLPSLNLTPENQTILEGLTLNQKLSYTVNLSAASAETVMVEYFTQAGTATSGTDYLPISGTLTFAPGVTSRTLQVSILDDTLLESDETFQLVLQNSVNATLNNAVATAIITDTLFSATTKTLPGQVENLTLTGNGAINATGNRRANRLIGNDQANILKGGNGVDVLTGLEGNDIFDLTRLKANAHRDLITDFTPGEDRARLSNSLTTRPGKGIPAWLEMVPQGVITLAMDQFDLFVFNAEQTEADVDLSLTGKGTQLLDGLNPAAGSAKLMTTTTGSLGYLLAYDNGDAYLYAFRSGADTVVSASEIDLIATFANLAPGSLSSGDFRLI